MRRNLSRRPTFKKYVAVCSCGRRMKGKDTTAVTRLLRGRSEREGVKRMIERTAIEYRAESRILVLSAERLTNRADSEAQYLAASAAARMANLLERGFSMEQAQALAMGEDIQS